MASRKAQGWGLTWGSGRASHLNRGWGLSWGSRRAPRLDRGWGLSWGSMRAPRLDCVWYSVQVNSECLVKGNLDPASSSDPGSGSSVGVLVAGIAGGAGVLGVRRAVRSVPRATNTAFFCSGVRDCQSLSAMSSRMDAVVLNRIASMHWATVVYLSCLHSVFATSNLGSKTESRKRSTRVRSV